MSNSKIKRHVIFYLALATVTTVALYLVFTLDFQWVLTEAIARQTNLPPPQDHVLNITEILLIAILVVVIVRAVNEGIFGIGFRIRRGYEAPSLLRNIFSIIVYVSIFVVLFKWYYPAVDIGALFTTSAIFGVIIGLALQDTLGNLFAGVSLQADKPFQVGDVITVGQWTGVVEGVTWRGIKIRTFQNHIVLISNSSAAKEAIQVCPRDNLNARLVLFNTLYTDSPAKTIHVVREAVREVENVSSKMTPVVRIRSLAADGPDYEVKYWLDDYARYNDTDALIRQRIWYAFKRASINFAYPSRTLYVAPRTKPAEKTDGTGLIERLSAVEIFAPLSEEEISRLAKSTVSHVFAPGEPVIRAGERGSSMFVVHRGRVQVQTIDDGRPRTVAALNEGDFFGEMALFTGEPRTANVIAVEETEVIEIGHRAMKHLFESNPDLVEALSYVIAERRRALTERPDDQEAVSKASAGILSAIRKFFGIT